mgnify:CR=1 FL=1
MLKYLSSFFRFSKVVPKDDTSYSSKPVYKSETEVRDTPKCILYELSVKWYGNFIGETNKILTKEYTLDIEENEDLLDAYKSLFLKLSNQYRLIDYMQRRRLGMFKETFRPGKFHIDTLVIRRGVKYTNGCIKYSTPLYENIYNISIDVDVKKNWEII